MTQEQTTIITLIPCIKSLGFADQSYPGSLTAPPCTEGVRWLVMSEIQEAAREQIDRISALTGSQANNRPVQPLGARTVTFRG